MQIRNFWRSSVASALIAISASGHAQSKLGYDPAADPFAELRAAEAIAAAEDKEILIVAGGDWCIWCHYLDAFLKGNPKINEAFEDTFVMVKTYIGDENDNSAFFAKLPEAAGYPHFWVLASDGTVLASQNTLPLEDGDKSYDERNFVAFIERWATTP